MKEIKRIYIFLICIAIAHIANTQNVEFKESNFTDKAGFRKAEKYLIIGDRFYSEQKKVLYGKAVSSYLKAQEFNPNNALLNFKIGYCYLYGAGANKSLPYLLKAKELDSTVEERINYYTAYAYQFNLIFDKAIELYKKYLAGLSKEERSKYTSFIEDKIKECENGRDFSVKNENIKVLNLGDRINSAFDDYAPLVTKDEKTIIFTTKRLGNTGGEKDKEGQYFEDIYISKKSDDKWSYPIKISPRINTPSHEAVIGFSIDGKTLLIYKGLTNGGDIYESKSDSKGNWSTPKPLSPIINSPWQESSACFSSDGKSLYFTSNREDMSLGERDIFVSKSDSSGNWGYPTNLGATINTAYDEEGVYLCEDGKTIYFSSKGHNSIGGYDIFRSSIDENGIWSKPANLGYPVNTTGDDMYAIVYGEGDSLKGFFSGDREDSYGGKDIYKFFNEKYEKKVSKDTSTIFPVDSNLIVKNDSINQKLNDSLKNKNIAINDTTDITDTTKIKNIAVNNTIDTIKNKNITINDVIDTVKNKNITINEPVDSIKNKNLVINDQTDTTIQNKNIKNIKNINKNLVPDSVVGVIFYVQVGASHRKMPYEELHTRYPGKMQVTEIWHDTWHKYLIGKFKKYSEARELKFNCGTWDAWVVTTRDGVRINIREILNLLSYYPAVKTFIDSVPPVYNMDILSAEL